MSVLVTLHGLHISTIHSPERPAYRGAAPWMLERAVIRHESIPRSGHPGPSNAPSWRPVRRSPRSSVPSANRPSLGCSRPRRRAQSHSSTSTSAVRRSRARPTTSLGPCRLQVYVATVVDEVKAKEARQHNSCDKALPQAAPEKQNQIRREGHDIAKCLGSDRGNYCHGRGAEQRRHREALPRTGDPPHRHDQPPAPAKRPSCPSQRPCCRRAIRRSIPLLPRSRRAAIELRHNHTTEVARRDAADIRYDPPPPSPPRAPIRIADRSIAPS